MGTYYSQLRRPFDNIEIEKPDIEGACVLVTLFSGGPVAEVRIDPEYLNTLLRIVSDPEPTAKRSNVGGGRTVTQLIRTPDKNRGDVMISEYGEIVRGGEWALPVAGSIVTGVDDA